MGAVYRAEDPQTGQIVAIKTMVAEVAIQTEAYVRFLREVQAACTIRHRNVIQIYGFDTHEGTPYLIMEYLRGEALNDLIARGPLAVDRAADITGAVCSAMIAVHAHDILHRDLKPSNIFLADSDEGEQVKVLDFGVSKLRAAQNPKTTASSAIIGSIHYMSPEQTRGGELDERSDLFAIGVILYECLTGRRPHAGETVFDISDGIMRGTFRRPREHRPEIPEGLEQIILKAMSLAPGDRYASVRDLGAAILPYASQAGQRQLADPLRGAAARRLRGQVSAPMPAEWFKNAGGRYTEGYPLRSDAVRVTTPAETRLLPTASLPERLSGGPVPLGDTRALPNAEELSVPRDRDSRARIPEDEVGVPKAATPLPDWVIGVSERKSSWVGRGLLVAGPLLGGAVVSVALLWLLSARRPTPHPGATARSSTPALTETQRSAVWPPTNTIPAPPAPSIVESRNTPSAHAPPPLSPARPAPARLASAAAPPASPDETPELHESSARTKTSARMDRRSKERRHPKPPFVPAAEAPRTQNGVLILE
jgi:hypothetical protein